MQEEINHLLIKLEEQYGRILSYNEKIPVVEIDLVLKDVQDLYEGFLDLRTAAEWQRRNAKPAEQSTPQNQQNIAPELAASNTQGASIAAEPAPAVVAETPSVEEPQKEFAKAEDAGIVSTP